MKIPFYLKTYTAIEKVLTIAQKKIDGIYSRLPDGICESAKKPDILEWWDKVRYKTYVWTFWCTPNGKMIQEKHSIVIFARSERTADLAYRKLWLRKCVSGHIFGVIDVSCRYGSNRNCKWAKDANKIISDGDMCYVADVNDKGEVEVRLLKGQKVM